MSKSLIFALLAIMIISSCNNKNNFNVEIIEPADADGQIASLNNQFLNDPTSPYNQVSGAPDMWAAFEQFFKACVKNSGTPGNSLFSKYRLLYLGPSNPSYLGAIYSTNGVVPKTNLTDWVTPEQIASGKFIQTGIEVPGCDISQIKDQFFSITLGKLPFSSGDTSLKFVVNNMDTIVNSVGSWTIDKLVTENLTKFLNENSSNKDLVFYKKTMVKDNNVIAFQVVKVKGFSADINLSKDFKSSLNLSLPILTGKGSGGKDSTICSLKFNKTTDRTVHVQSDGEFYAFALVMKGKKI